MDIMEKTGKSFEEVIEYTKSPLWRPDLEAIHHQWALTRGREMPSLFGANMSPTSPPSSSDRDASENTDGSSSTVRMADSTLGYGMDAPARDNVEGGSLSLAGEDFEQHLFLKRLTKAEIDYIEHGDSHKKPKSKFTFLETITTTRNESSVGYSKPEVPTMKMKGGVRRGAPNPIKIPV